MLNNSATSSAYWPSTGSNIKQDDYSRDSVGKVQFDSIAIKEDDSELSNIVH